MIGFHSVPGCQAVNPRDFSRSKLISFLLSFQAVIVRHYWVIQFIYSLKYYMRIQVTLNIKAFVLLVCRKRHFQVHQSDDIHVLLQTVPHAFPLHVPRHPNPCIKAYCIHVENRSALLKLSPSKHECREYITQEICLCPHFL